VLWFGTFGGGLSRFDVGAFRAGARDEAWTTYTARDGLAEDVISCMALAPDGTLWIGAADNGVSHFDGSTWTNYTAAHGLIDNEILSMVLAPDGVLWASSINGVSYLSSSE